MVGSGKGRLLASPNAVSSSVLASLAELAERQTGATQAFEEVTNKWNQSLIGVRQLAVDSAKTTKERQEEFEQKLLSAMSVLVQRPGQGQLQEPESARSEPDSPSPNKKEVRSAYHYQKRRAEREVRRADKAERGNKKLKKKVRLLEQQMQAKVIRDLEERARNALDSDSN